MKRAILTLALLACGCDERFRNPSVAPAARNCLDCVALCKPFEVSNCEPVNYSESGRIAYMKCACAPVPAPAPKETPRGR